MPFVTFPSGTMEVFLQFLINGIPGEIGIGVLKTSGAATATDGSTICTAVAAWWNATAKPGFVASTVLNNVKAIDLTSSIGWQYTLSVGVAGTNAGIANPNQVSMVVKLLTGLRGRSYHGRVYLPGLPTTALFSTIQWTTAAQTTYPGYLATLDTTLAASSYAVSVLSRVYNGAPRGTGVVTRVTAYDANPRIATQRRRLF